VDAVTLDRYLAAFRLIENVLLRQGLPATDEQVLDVLNALPLPPVVRLAIMIAPLTLTQDATDWPVRVEWRAHSLARNPFA
jgi:hypothetical protein